MIVPTARGRGDIMASVSGWRITAAELDRRVSGLNECIDAAALAPECWDDVLEGLQALLPGLRAGLDARDAALDQPLAVGAKGWDDSTLRAYLGYYSAISPWPAAWTKVKLLSPHLSDHALPMAELTKTEFYNDWLKPIGDAEHGTGIKLLASQGRVATIYMHYGSHRMEEQHAILAPVLSRLGPRLRGALLANRTLAIGYPHRPDGSLMDSLLDPAFLLDEDCRLMAANAAGEALIRQDMLVRVGARDAFRLRSSPGHQQLAKAVNALCRTGTSGAGDDFPLAGEGQTWMVSLLPVAPNAALAVKTTLALFMPRACALVVLRRTAQPAAPANGRIIALPHLTPAEQRLAQALLEGGSLVEIAARLGIAYGTARTQLKVVFAKTGTHNQRELISLLLRTTAG